MPASIFSKGRKGCGLLKRVYAPWRDPEFVEQFPGRRQRAITANRTHDLHVKPFCEGNIELRNLRGAIAMTWAS